MTNYNSKNGCELKINENILFKEGGLYYWPGTFNEALFLLRTAPYSSNKNHMVETERPDEYVEDVTRDWSFAIFVKSALYCFLQEKFARRARYKSKEKTLAQYDWILITPLLMHSSINKEIILFIEDIYKAPHDFIIEAAHFSIKRMLLFKYMVISESSLNDFLVFLKIDLLSREIIVKRCFNNQNFDQLIDFLFAVN